jgi:hypothetical protein
MTLTPHSLLVPRSKKQSNAKPLLSLRAFMACKKSETVRNTLRIHLHQTGLSDSPLCSCGAQDETSAHIHCECAALASLRHVYLGCCSLELEDINSIRLGAVWNFHK